MHRFEATRRPGTVGQPNKFLAFARCTRGATAVEYALIGASIALVLVISARLVGGVVIQMLAGALNGF